MTINSSHRWAVMRRGLAGTALGLLAALALPVGAERADNGIRAWVSFEQQGNAVTIRGFARAATPVSARYSMRVDTISDSGRSRSRSASHVRLGPDNAPLGRIAVRSGDGSRVEVELVIEAMDGQRLRIQEQYPAPGTWATAPRAGTMETRS